MIVNPCDTLSSGIQTKYKKENLSRVIVCKKNKRERESEAFREIGICRRRKKISVNCFFCLFPLTCYILSNQPVALLM